jgi:Pyridine nucleotide-disulphide oxidoreductase, dimerisation domain
LFRDSSEPTCTRKRLYQFTAIDDRTRLRVLKVYEACNQGTAIRFLDGMLRRLPFRVQVVQTDNGAEFPVALRYLFRNNGKAIAAGDTDGFIKVLFDADSDRLLGAHLIGPEVTELVQGFVTAMTLGAREQI